MAAMFRTAWAPMAALALASIVPVSPAAENEAKPRAGANRAADERREAAEILRAFQEIGAALKDDAKGRAKAAPASAADLFATLGRPARTVVKSSLEPAAIDALLEKSLAESKTIPARLTSDEEFVRRVYLDVTGKLPTPEQVLGFVGKGGKHKRAELIESLLASDDYAENWARYWRDVIAYHATNQNRRLIGYDQLEAWLAEQFKKNRPWDEVAAGMITATGTSDDNGAVGFFLAHLDGQQVPPVEVAGEVSRIFLGVQIQCAQCHDHPSDVWKREQFHEFAAFFAGFRGRRRGGAGAQQMPDLGPVGRVSYAMPDLKDPQKQIPVPPRFFLAGESTPPIPGNLNAQQRRELAASFVTGQDNPWFARAYVNRIWAALMGEGFYMPVDDMGPTREAKAGEVIDKLAAEWQHGGYDVRWLFRTILNTKAYQRESRSTASAAGRTPFAAVCASRLRADQILDNLDQALGLNLGAGRPQGAKNPKGTQQPVAVAKGRAGARVLFNGLFGVDPSTPVDDVMGTIPQALFLMNGPQVNRAIQASKNTALGQILAEFPDNRLALEALYLRVLARRPNADEVRTCANYLMKSPSRKEGFEDILWALVNSTEFLQKR